MAKTSASESPNGVVKMAGSLERAMAAARSAVENQAQDLLILDLREQTPLFDYFVLATGRSGRQIRAIADDIEEVLKKQFRDRRLSVEGYSESRWIVLDFGDIVIHLFDPQAREFYRLEDLWADAKRVALEPTGK